MLTGQYAQLRSSSWPRFFKLQAKTTFHQYDSVTRWLVSRAGYYRFTALTPLSSLSVAIQVLQFGQHGSIRHSVCGYLGWKSKYSGSVPLTLLALRLGLGPRSLALVGARQVSPPVHILSCLALQLRAGRNPRVGKAGATEASPLLSALGQLCLTPGRVTQSRRVSQLVNSAVSN